MRSSLITVLASLILQGCVERTLSQHKLQADQEEGPQATSAEVLPSKDENDDVDELITILSDEQLRGTEPERVTRAIIRLGEIRSVDAINDLAKLLTFEQTSKSERNAVTGFGEDHPTTPLSRYPAASALFQIGKPALPAIIKEIETHESGSLASENAIYTVMMIHRDNKLEAVKYLEEAATKASSSLASERLLAGVAKIERELKKIESVLNKG